MSWGSVVCSAAIFAQADEDHGFCYEEGEARYEHPSAEHGGPGEAKSCRPVDKREGETSEEED